MGVSPEVRLGLGVDPNLEIVVAALKHFRATHILISVDADQVLTQFLESLIEGIFVVFSLTLAE
jgi:tRNA G46 methylase TrmB